MAFQLSRRRFTVDEYHRMGETGVLAPEERVELLDGEVVEMSPIGSPHAGCVMRLNRLLQQRFGDVALVSVQGPTVADEYSEPEPDLMLLRIRQDYYSSSHPTPDDILLLIEVADTSLAKDRRVKMPLYARDGVAEAWIVDLVHQRLLVYREPEATGYKVFRTLSRRETISPLAFPGRQVAVAEILG